MSHNPNGSVRLDTDEYIGMKSGIIGVSTHIIGPVSPQHFGRIIRAQDERSRSSLDGSSDALISAATANVGGHAFVNVFVSGLGLAFQQGNGLHDLPRLAVAALRNIELHPHLLDGMEPVGADILNCADFGSR